MSVFQTSLDSFHNSLFQGVPMPLLRLNYSTSLGNRNYSLTRGFIWSNSINEQDHYPGNSRFSFKKNKYHGSSSSQTPLSHSNDGNSSQPSISKSNRMDRNSSNGWLEKWKKTTPRFPHKAPRQALNYRTRENVFSSFNPSSESSRNNASGSSTMDKIVEKLKKFGYMDDENEGDNNQERRIEKGSVEDIFYVEEGMLPNTRGGFSEDFSLETIFDNKDDEVTFPWEKSAVKKVEEAKNSVKRRSRTYMAELTLPESELTRLKNLTLRTKQKVKIGGSGVTQLVVDKIHEKWKSCEIVRLKVEGAPALNVRRIHEILEVWIALSLSILDVFETSSRACQA